MRLNDSDNEVICPLFFSSLNNKERIRDSVKYVINTRSLMDKKYVFLPLNLHGIHWALVIAMPQTSTSLYFDSLLTPSNLTNQLNLITSFFNFYCVVHKVQQIHWDYVICDEAYQQKNDKDWDMFCCLNAYNFLNAYVYYEEEDSLTVRCWIAYQCTKFNFSFVRMTKVIDFEDKSFFGNLKIKTTINTVNLLSRTIRDNNRPSHYRNVFDDIKSLYFKAHSVQSISSPIISIKSETETDKEYDEIEQKHENKKSAIMNGFDKCFNFYKDKFLENVKKLTNHLPNDSLS